ncbi:hypothetical protein P3T75_09645 [Enterococcus montenegrensis]|uniref:hypothetical protein n=1 Tax=Enterococcus montenegrensis TaxID=3031993 RepID=UPI00249F0682|nr:hypothetical protein [Enterococcus montenegrensis]WHA08577.1 hypothetical protein P3T75_09645 [Enterococcus montenegrensis]
MWIKKDYAVKDLLNILENMLKDVHSTYDADKSVRMQEKYWLLRYFVYYLIDKRIIEEVDIQQHYNGNRIARDKNSIIKSELNKNYVLHKDSIKKAYVNKINEFYELLLNWGVALVQVGSDESLFEYL